MALTKISGGVVQPDNFNVGVITATSLNAAGVVTASTVQVGSATTIHTSGIDLGSGSITSHNINSTGIITASRYIGNADITGGSIVATAATFSGNVSVAGVLTYEDVTSVDAIGLSTFQNGIHVTGGSVGIGTDNPAEDVHIQAARADVLIEGTNDTVSGNVANLSLMAPYYRKVGYSIKDSAGNEDFFIGRPYGQGDANPDLVINMTGTEKVRIKNNGNVGIGTDNPTQKLTVFDVISVKGYPGGSSQVLFSDTDSDYSGRLFYNHTTNALKFFVNSEERLCINSSGQVGINTITPQATLDVWGDVSITNQDGGIAFSDPDDKAEHHVLYMKSGDNSLNFRTYNGTDGWVDRVKLNTSGKLFVAGTGSDGVNTTELPNGSTININGKSSSDGFSVIRYHTGYGAYGLNIGRSKSDTLGTNAAVTNGNDLGHITFYGADGTDFNQAAQITAQVDGTPSDGTDMPGRLLLRTSPEASATPETRVCIDSSGRFLHGTGTTALDSAAAAFGRTGLQGADNTDGIDKGLIIRYDNGPSNIDLNGTNNYHLLLQNAAYAGTGIADPQGSITKLLFKGTTYNGWVSYGYIALDTQGASGNKGDLVFGTGNPTERMRITSSGTLNVSNSDTGNDSAVNVLKSSGDNADKAILRVGYDASNCFEIYRTRTDADIYLNTTQSGAETRIQYLSKDVATISDRGALAVGKLIPKTVLYSISNFDGNFNNETPTRFYLYYSSGASPTTHHFARMISQPDWSFVKWSVRQIKTQYTATNDDGATWDNYASYSNHNFYVSNYNQQGSTSGGGNWNVIGRNQNLGPGGTFQIHAAANGGYYRDAWATDYYVSLPAYIHVILEITVWSWGGNAWDSSTSVTDIYPASFGGSATQAQADSWNVGRGIWFDAAPGSFTTRSGTIPGIVWDT